MEVERAEYLHGFMEETDWINSIVLDTLLPGAGNCWRRLPRPIQSWLRNYIAGNSVYFLTGFLWCLYIYHWKRNVDVPKDHVPSKDTMLLQIYVSMKTMPWYCALPSLSEYIIEKGWTKCYSSISEVGLTTYLTYSAIYLVLVEFGIYWIHRELHDIKPLYKYLHATHHIYNKQNTVSPFAGMAFHPLDGILQAMPHVLVLFIVPAHFLTHIMLIFCEAVWAANIHDCNRWEAVACDGSRIPHHPPHHLSPQLRPLHSMDGLDVRDSPVSRGRRRLEEAGRLIGDFSCRVMVSLSRLVLITFHVLSPL